jgi:cell division protein FtsI/penicillin-binding protein 2
LEEAVDFGTAQFAKVPGMKIAGKTGSTRRPATGEFIAWFAGFTPSRSPEKVVVVMLAGHSGGADAAPVAAQVLSDSRRGRL